MIVGWTCLASKQTKIHIIVCVASTMQYLTQHPHAHVVGSVLIGLSVVHSYRETPGPIPNPEAKPVRADGTATGRLWESKSPPTPNNKNKILIDDSPHRTNLPIVLGGWSCGDYSSFSTPLEFRGSLQHFPLGGCCCAWSCWPVSFVV